MNKQKCGQNADDALRIWSPGKRGSRNTMAASKTVTFSASDRVTVSQSSSDEDLSEEEVAETDSRVPESSGSGWSDAMNRLLNCQVKSQNFILAKAKKDRDVINTDKTSVRHEFEVVKESGEREVVSDVTADESQKEKKERKEDVCRKLRQKATDADIIFEKQMNAIATRGVVQLFNAVNQQRSRISKKLQEAGPSETRKDRVLASVSKGEFLDSLKQVKEQDDEAEDKSEPIAKRTKKSKKDGQEKIRFKDVFSDTFAQQQLDDANEID